MSKCLATHQPQPATTIGVRREDGRISWGIVTVIPTSKFATDEMTGAVVTFLDVTERKQLEEQLRQSQKMEAIGRLAGGIAHDFNNLLTAIIGYSQLLLGRLEVGNPMQDQLEEIKKAGERAASLTRQLLAFSRKGLLQPQVLDLNALVANIDKMLRRLIGEHIELVTMFGPGLERVEADPAQLEQVVLNLVVNARDAMPQGGKIVIETKNLGLDEAYTHQHPGVSPGRYTMLSVSDEGHGMAAETLKHIFEPFYTTKDHAEGTGLGLFTVYGAVKQNGGNIWVYSEIGRGTTFKVYLPQVNQVVEVRKADALSTAAAGGHRNGASGRGRKGGKEIRAQHSGEERLYRPRGTPRIGSPEGGPTASWPHRPFADRYGNAADGRETLGGKNDRPTAWHQGPVHVRLQRKCSDSPRHLGIRDGFP